ncbi:plastocyanin/azurin family copper-binding protein [Planococcus faecalis]|uniref:plastocyanin/azurin family copper-binding protein n=1 Tax=Planococcus faecalis TaxID=1598147 RepID=UPI0008DA7C99|nr:plastocyanin/azurin family copper-binding protein [Planococcus faecalis]OHX51679.1 hypothetical protein BB777_16045 [Planococcus faecalis]
MMNKKFSFILAAGLLSLTACGQEQPVAEESAEPMAEEQESTAEEPTQKNRKKKEETATEEEVTEEEPAEETTEEEPAQESTPEAMSGTASELLSNGEMTSFVFNEAGEFAIFCEPHPVMQMTVIVEEGAECRSIIDIADYDFSEESITVAPGTTIVWTNQDQVQHNVAFE